MAFINGLRYHPMIEPVQGKPVGKKPTEQISNLIILFPCNLHESSQVGKAAVVWVINVPICSCIWALGFQLPVFFVELWRWKLAGGRMSLRLGWELQPCPTSNLLSLLCIYGSRCDLLASCSCPHAWLLLSLFPLRDVFFSLWKNKPKQALSFLSCLSSWHFITASKK